MDFGWELRYRIYLEIDKMIVEEKMLRIRICSVCIYSNEIGWNQIVATSEIGFKIQKKFFQIESLDSVAKISARLTHSCTILIILNLPQERCFRIAI